MTAERKRQGDDRVERRPDLEQDVLERTLREAPETEDETSEDSGVSSFLDRFMPADTSENR
ncbi:hypothetical protein [Hansschlegelia plantiphila]|uniref:Uncharacterized protein n=1 Tax=Hansschlegelia plantiphila TaxID=374655 RepID=A0A9W6J019_9HYPH|nr:hypothetical protein [Hansschlegelia plantiphila]GLK67233.1 hypothetical protein GCM10008179_08710 [Hansschlegelia plantiphila]